MIEIINTERVGVTDQEVVEAVNTIRRYCKSNDIRDCAFNCAIRQTCKECFCNPITPDSWPEMEVPE